MADETLDLTAYNALVEQEILPQVTPDEGVEWKTEKEYIDAAKKELTNLTIADYEKGLHKDVRILKDSLESGYDVTEYAKIQNQLQTLENVDVSKLNADELVNAFLQLSAGDDEDNNVLATAFAAKGSLDKQVEKLISSNQSVLRTILKDKKTELDGIRTKAAEKYSEKLTPITESINKVEKVFMKEVNPTVRTKMRELFVPTGPKNTTKYDDLIQLPEVQQAVAFWAAQGAFAKGKMQDFDFNSLPNTKVAKKENNGQSQESSETTDAFRQLLKKHNKFY